MMRVAGGLLLILTLSACVAGQSVMQDTTRSLARNAVDSTAQRYFPGVDVSPFTDCVINNASTGEILQLARAASKASAGAAVAGGAGVQNSAVSDAATEALPVVRTILGRSEAQQCLIASAQGAGLAAGLLGGGMQ